MMTLRERLAQQVLAVSTFEAQAKADMACAKTAAELADAWDRKLRFTEELTKLRAMQHANARICHQV